LFVRSILAFVLVALLLLPASARAAGEHVLLALYYPWFSPENFGPGLTSDTPAEPYESDDPAVMARQIDQARRAGLDAFVVAWLGPDDRTDRNLATMLDQAAARGFRVSVYFETASMGGSDAVASNLDYLLSHYGGHPSFLRQDGRPVVFFWRQQMFAPETWAGIRQQVDPGWGSVWIAEGTTTAYLNAFNGLHLFNISWAPDPAQPLQTWSSRTRAAEAAMGATRIWVPTIMAGYNDIAVRGGYARSREDGAYYRRTMEAALATDPQWAVLVTSWNEWPEGTQIEPSTTYGDFYLQLTAEFARRLKGS
jgi:hypothetical protein